MSAKWIRGESDVRGVVLQMLPDGTNGYKGEFYITNLKFDGPMDGASKISFTAKMTGAPTAL